MSADGRDSLRALASVVRGSFGVAHEHHPSLTSTNDRAAAWAQQGAPHGAVVTADAQTDGRGRRGNRWVSNPGENLCVSVVWRPQAAREDFGAVSLVTGLGLLRGLALPGTMLKWPNDLLLGGRKLGGVLCESKWLEDRPTVVLGFGLNVHQAEFEGELAQTATSLALQGAAGPRLALLADLLLSLERTLAEFDEGGFVSLRHDYLDRCALQGKTVRASHQGAPIEGVVEGIDELGSLLLRMSDGQLHAVSSGDVQQVRPV